MLKIKDVNNDWVFLYDPKTKVLNASFLEEGRGVINNSAIYDVECDNLVLAIKMAENYCTNFDGLKGSFIDMIEDPCFYNVCDMSGDYHYSDEFLNSSFKEKLENAKKDYLRFDEPQEDDDLPF